MNLHYIRKTLLQNFLHRKKYGQLQFSVFTSLWGIMPHVLQEVKIGGIPRIIILRNVDNTNFFVLKNFWALIQVDFRVKVFRIEESFSE